MRINEKNNLLSCFEQKFFSDNTGNIGFRSPKQTNNEKINNFVLERKKNNEIT